MATPPRLPAHLHDARGFAATVAPLLPELRRSARRLGAPGAEVEDVVQEAVLRAWLFRARFEPGTNARAWLHCILRNTAHTRHRRRARERSVLERLGREAEGPREAPAPAVEGLDDTLEGALAALPEEFARVVELVDLRGLAYREAAERLGCPVGTVMSRLHRARRALRLALGPRVAEAA